MKIDAHVHFWDLSLGHDIWISRKIEGLQRNFTPDMLRPQCQAAGVDGVVVIQAAPTPAETKYMVELAAKDPFILGVIGWVDLESEQERLDAELTSLGVIPKFRGIRAHPPREFDPRWLSDPTVRRGYQELANRNLSVDFLVNCTQLQQTLQLLREIPEMTAIVDHGGRPFVMTGQTEEWAKDMGAIARETNAYIKLSGLIERAGVEWTAETLRPWIETLLELFGCSRLIFASNWPVMTLMGSWTRWWEALHEILDILGVGQEERDQLLGGTAANVYRLDSL